MHRHQSDGWTMVSNSVKPSGNYVVLDLSPATWYQLRGKTENCKSLREIINRMVLIVHVDDFL